MSREENLKELNRLQDIIKEAEIGIDRLFGGPAEPKPATAKGSKKCGTCGEIGHNSSTCGKNKPTNGQDTERPLEFPYTGDASTAS